MKCLFYLKLVISNLLILPLSTNAITFSSFEFPPFTQKLEKNKMSGPFKEMVSDICKEMGEQCTFLLLPNIRSKKMVSEGEVDGGFPYGWNQDRSKKLYFSVPFMVSEYGLFVKSSKIGISNIKDIQGFKVGVFGPSNTSRSLEKVRESMVKENLTPIEIKMRTDPTKGSILMLSEGRIDGYFSNKSAGLYLVNNNNISNVSYAFTSKNVTYFVAFPKATSDLNMVKKFNKAALKVFSRDNYLKEKLARWDISLPNLSQEVLDQYNILR